MIQVKVNHQIHQLEDRSSYPLSEALSVFIPDLPDKGIAVALNGQVVRRPQWASTLLSIKTVFSSLPLHKADNPYKHEKRKHNNYHTSIPEF